MKLITNLLVRMGVLRDDLDYHSILLPTSVLLQPTPASARVRIHMDAFPEEDRPSGSRGK
jgi:hypothetical protein